MKTILYKQNDHLYSGMNAFGDILVIVRIDIWMLAINGKFVDNNQFRYDLAERNNIELTEGTLS